MNIKKPLYGEWEAKGFSVPATIGSHIFVFGDIKLFLTSRIIVASAFASSVNIWS
mgnify:CR=1 FL=1